MSHRYTVIASVAIALLFAGGVFAGRERLMPANPSTATTPIDSSGAVTNVAQSEPPQQVSLPPLSPDERASTTRSLDLDPAGAFSTSGTARDEDESWDEDDEDDDEELEEDDDDDDGEHERDEDEDDDD